MTVLGRMGVENIYIYTINNGQSLQLPLIPLILGNKTFSGSHPLFTAFEYPDSGIFFKPLLCDMVHITSFIRTHKNVELCGLD